MVVPSSPGRGYRPALDGLRAVAVVAVVAYHLGLPGLLGGFLGVDLFFVLSGFLITGLLLDAHERYGRIDLAQFWRRRMRRLLPALLLMLVTVAIAVRLWEPAPDWAARRGEMLGGLFYYANWHLVLTRQSYFDGDGALSALGHLWSLSIEEQFYVWWPLTLLVLLWRRPSWRRLTTVIGALAVASAVVMVLVYSPGDPTRAYVGTDARAQELLIGALLVLMVRRFVPEANRAGREGQVSWPIGPLALAASAGSVGLLLVVPDSGGFYYRGGATLIALVFAGLIWSVEQAPASAVARVLAFRPLVWIGTISYGLYLWHLPVIRYLPEALPWRLPSPALAVACVVVTVALAATSYYALERPIRYGRLRLALDTTWKVAVSGAVAAVCCAFVVVASTTSATGLQAQQIAEARRAQQDADGTTTTADLGPLCPDSTSICRRLEAKPGRRTIAVLGDSIARSLDPGFYDLAARNGWGYVLAAHNGCGLTSLLSVAGPQQRGFLKKCADETAGRIDEVLAEHHPDLVISLSRWELIAHQDPDGTTVEPATAKWAENVHTELRAFARTVVRSGADLAMLAVLPGTSATPKCVKKPEDTSCAAPPDALTVAANDIYRQVAGEVPGASLVSMQDLVCPSDQCRALIQGVLVRFDGMHFSEAGARWFVRGLESRLPAATPR